MPSCNTGQWLALAYLETWSYISQRCRITSDRLSLHCFARFPTFQARPSPDPRPCLWWVCLKVQESKPIQQFCGRTWSSFPLSSGMFWVRRALSVFGNVTSGFAIVDCRWPSMRYIFYRGLLWVSIVKLDFLNPTFSQHEKSFSHWHHLVGGASEKSQKQQNSQQILLLADSVGLYIWRVLEYDTEVAFTLCSVFLPLTWIDLQRVSPLTFALLRHGLVRSVSCQVEKLPPFWSHTGVGVPSRWFVHCQPAMFICLMFLYVFVLAVQRDWVSNADSACYHWVHGLSRPSLWEVVLLWCPLWVLH